MSAPGIKIGLEVHVYLNTHAKLFCPCPSDFLAAGAPNSNVCVTCTAQPGAKPMAPNAAAVSASVRLARALRATVSADARFLRKHYFYPDLPANFQRTSEPIATGGFLAGVALTELHVEEDPGAFDPATGLIDFNRAGAPLIELVTEPEVRDPEHARRFLQELRLVLAYLGIQREEAGMKADCNISLQGGARVEVKNVNSARNVEAALAHEMARQQRVLDQGGQVVRETRHFDEATGTTRSMREKESAADYRFLPDPDLLLVDLARVQDALPTEELPLARRERLARAVGVEETLASPLIEERALADAYDVLSERVDPRAAYDFLLRDVRGELGYRGQSLAASRIDAEGLASLLEARERRRITPQVATRLLRHGLDHGGLEAALAQELRAATPSDDGLQSVVDRVLREHTKAVDDYHAGKAAAINFLVGQAMKILRGRADANALRDAVTAALQASER